MFDKRYESRFCAHFNLYFVHSIPMGLIKENKLKLRYSAKLSYAVLWISCLRYAYNHFNLNFLNWKLAFHWRSSVTFQNYMKRVSRRISFLVGFIQIFHLCRREEFTQFLRTVFVAANYFYVGNQQQQPKFSFVVDVSLSLTQLTFCRQSVKKSIVFRE